MTNDMQITSGSNARGAERDRPRSRAAQRTERERDGAPVGTQYMLIATAIVELGGFVYLALTA